MTEQEIDSYLLNYYTSEYLENMRLYYFYFYWARFGLLRAISSDLMFLHTYELDT